MNGWSRRPVALHSVAYPHQCEQPAVNFGRRGTHRAAHKGAQALRAVVGVLVYVYWYIYVYNSYLQVTFGLLGANFDLWLFGALFDLWLLGAFFDLEQATGSSVTHFCALFFNVFLRHFSVM